MGLRKLSTGCGALAWFFLVLLWSGNAAGAYHPDGWTAIEIRNKGSVDLYVASARRHDEWMKYYWTYKGWMKVSPGETLELLSTPYSAQPHYVGFAIHNDQAVFGAVRFKIPALASVAFKYANIELPVKRGGPWQYRQDSLAELKKVPQGWYPMPFNFLLEPSDGQVLELNLSPHADAPVTPIGGSPKLREHQGNGSRLDRLLSQSLSSAFCYRSEGVLMTYPEFAAGVSEDGSVYVEGLENRVDGKLTNKSGRSTIPLDKVRDTRIVPSSYGDQPRCTRLSLRCPKKEKCARREGVRSTSISLYFNSTERANEVADLLVPPSEDSIKAGAAPKLPQKSASEPSSHTEKASPLNDTRLYRLFGFVGLIVILILGVLSFERNGAHENASERESEGQSMISHAIFLMANLVICTGYIIAAALMAMIGPSDFKGFFDPNDVLKNIFTLSGGVFFLVGFGFLLAWINKKPKQKTKRLISFVCTAVYAGSFFVIVWAGTYRGPFLLNLGWSYVILLFFFSILPFLGAIIWERMTIKGARR